MPRGAITEISGTAGPGKSEVVKKPALWSCRSLRSGPYGFLDLILHRAVHERYQNLFDRHAFLIVHGTLQKEGYSVSVLVQRLEPVLTWMISFILAPGIDWELDSKKHLS